MQEQQTLAAGHTSHKSKSPQETGNNNTATLDFREKKHTFAPPCAALRYDGKEESSLLPKEEAAHRKHVQEKELKDIFTSDTLENDQSLYAGF